MPKSSRAADGRDIASNRAAYHDYFVLEKFEAGLALLGTEIKGLRMGRTTLREGYVRVGGGEAWLMNVHIAPYEGASAGRQEARRGDPEGDGGEPGRRRYHVPRRCLCHAGLGG